MTNEEIFEAIRYVAVVATGTSILMPFALRGRLPARSEWHPQVVALEDKGLAVRLEEWIEAILASAEMLG